MHTFGGNTGSDFDIGFLDDHAAFNRLSSRSTILGGQHPLAIRVRQSANWNDTDAGLVVAAVARAEANSPTSLVQSV